MLPSGESVSIYAPDAGRVNVTGKINTMQQRHAARINVGTKGRDRQTDRQTERQQTPDRGYTIDNYIKYSLDFLRPIRTAEAFEAIDWLADLPQRTWPQAGRSSDVILLKSTATMAMFVGDRTTASTPLAGVAAMM